MLLMVLILKLLLVNFNASYLEIPKQGWEKFHEPYKDNANFAPAKTVNTVDRILPEPYIEECLFLLK